MIKEDVMKNRNVIEMIEKKKNNAKLKKKKKEKIITASLSFLNCNTKPEAALVAGFV